MRTPEQVRAALRRRFDGSLAAWLAEPSTADFSMPLHPPTAAEALADPPAVAQWIESWRTAPAVLREGVLWQERRWAQLGVQRLPVRWERRGAAALATCAGDRTAQQWRILSANVETAEAELATAVENRAPLRTKVAAAVAGQRSRWLEMSPLDAEITIRASTWFLGHPRSGVRVRQVPIPGMHTKWLTAHRGVVSRLVAAGRDDGSAGLGLAADPDFHDLLVLDPLLRGEGGSVDASRRLLFPRAARLDVAALASQTLHPRVVLLCENSETVQVLPDLPGTIALSGEGYSVPSLLSVPWIASAPVVYWGDLDADGFRILDRARHHHSDVTSALMDCATLETHRELVVDGGVRTPAALEMLTPEERRLHDELAASGERLEQERIELGFAVAALQKAVTAAISGASHRAGRDKSRI